MRLMSPALVLAAALAVAGCGSSPAEPTAPPTITQVQPASAAVGATVTIVGTGFTEDSNTVELGNGYIAKLSTDDPTTLRFTVPEWLNPCPPTGQACIAVIFPLQPGSYSVVVTNAHGRSNMATVQVTGR